MTADRALVFWEKGTPQPCAGQVIDSEKEAKRYVVLLGKQDRGEISGLRRGRGCTFALRVGPNNEVLCRYKADFMYVEHGTMVIEDVKSKITRMNRVYQLKKKMMKMILGFDIRET